MSIAYISVPLRRRVAAQADFLCEYCLLHESDTYFGCEVDHIISEKHGGPTQPDNLAYACLSCNRSKGSDIASLTPGTLALVRLFHPRRDRWHDHFLRDTTDGITLLPLTPIGEATARLLRFNDPRPPPGAPRPPGSRALPGPRPPASHDPPLTNTFTPTPHVPPLSSLRVCQCRRGRPGGGSYSPGGSTSTVVRSGRASPDSSTVDDPARTTGASPITARNSSTGASGRFTRPVP